jgi:hypothetical protein
VAGRIGSGIARSSSLPLEALAKCCGRHPVADQPFAYDGVVPEIWADAERERIDRDAEAVGDLLDGQELLHVILSVLIAGGGREGGRDARSSGHPVSLLAGTADA